MQEIRMNNNVTKILDISNAVFTTFTAFWGEHCTHNNNNNNNPPARITVEETTQPETQHFIGVA